MDIFVEVLDIVLLTVRVTGVALLLSTLIGVPVGALLAICHFRGRGTVVTTVYTGMGLPPVVVGLSVYLLLSRGGPLGGLGWLFSPHAMIFAQLIIALPLVIGLSMAAIQAVDPELILQVRSLGATRVQEIRALLREARVGVIAAVVAGFGAIISEVGAALLVGGNIAGQTRVLSTAIVLETRRGSFGLALALGGLLLGLAFTTNALLMKLQAQRAGR